MQARGSFLFPFSLDEQTRGLYLQLIIYVFPKSRTVVWNLLLGKILVLLLINQLPVITSHALDWEFSSVSIHCLPRQRSRTTSSVFSHFGQSCRWKCIYDDYLLIFIFLNWRVKRY